MYEWNSFTLMCVISQEINKPEKYQIPWLDRWRVGVLGYEIEAGGKFG